MILVELFLGFLKVGCFAFGGAYGAIPLIRDVVLSYGWLSEEMVSYMVAVSESTPGPIMVNMATYVGSTQGGFLGALAATLAVILPSFCILLLICTLMKSALKNPYAQAVLRGMKPCVVGIVTATGLYMVMTNCFGTLGSWGIHWQEIVLSLLLVGVMLGYKVLAKKKLSPLAFIALSALLGVLIY